MFGAMHVAAALVRRARTGEGAFIDVSGADAVISAAWIGATYDLNLHRVTDPATLPSRQGGEHTGARYNFYETSDRRFLLFCAIEPKFWRNFLAAIGRQDLDAQTSGTPVEWGVDLELRRQLAEIFRSRPLAEWMRIAVEHDIAMGPAPRNLSELRDDPYLADREIVVEGKHPYAGDFTYVGSPAVVREQPYEVRYPAPLLGEHTGEVLAEAGLTQAQIEHLRQQGVS